MRAVLVALTLAGLALAPSRGRAAEDKVKLSVLALNLAIDKARKDGDACRAAVMTPLKDARDALQSGAADVAVLTKTRRAVEDLIDGPAAQCGDAVKKELDRAMGRLQEAIDERAPAAPAPGASAATTSGNAAQLEAAKRCWNWVNAWTRVDPGCASTRDGKGPLDKAAFDKLLSKVRAAGDRFEKTAALEKAFGGEKLYLTALQLGVVIGLLGEEVDRLETVKRAAPTLVDPQHANTLSKHFRDPAMRKDALQTIDELRGSN